MLSTSSNSSLLVACRAVPSVSSTFSYPLSCVAREDCLRQNQFSQRLEGWHSKNTHATPTIYVSSSGTCLYTIGFANTRLAQPVRVEGWEGMVAELKIEIRDEDLFSQSYYHDYTEAVASNYRRLMSQSWG